jgi:hypothetical protein
MNEGKMPILDYEGYDQPNWGGYDELPISAETIALAERIAALLKEQPCDAPGGDGSIAFQWNCGDDILCLDICDGTIRMYGNVGGTFHRTAPKPDLQ